MLNEQSKLIVKNFAGIETLKLLVAVHLYLAKYDKAILIQKQIVAKERNVQNYYDLVRIFHRLVLPRIGEALILVRRNLANEANEIIKNVNKIRAIFADKDY